MPFSLSKYDSISVLFFPFFISFISISFRKVIRQINSTGLSFQTSNSRLFRRSSALTKFLFSIYSREGKKRLTIILRFIHFPYLSLFLSSLSLSLCLLIKKFGQNKLWQKYLAEVTAWMSLTWTISAFCHLHDMIVDQSEDSSGICILFNEISTFQ